MVDDPHSESAYRINTTALVGFFASGAVGALALFALPLFVDTSGVIGLDTFREPFIIITLVEFVAALGVLYFGMRLTTTRDDIEPAPDGGHEHES
ncbi:hypothetical protein BRD10_03500 [Halobacteriales archaeon SW_12_71_31]|nr:MAG: hypothetical protein BRD10_03500 [Halobacteriales archaeon SW_12_71_31]